MIATSIEQSKHLLELGLDSKTADMVYRCLPGPKEGMEQYIQLVPDKEYFETDIPAWSLSALLELIPNTGFDGIELNNYNNGRSTWTAIFNWKAEITPIRIADNPLDAVYELVVQLIEKGYIKQNNND